jgi:ketosteroid isomerase-like protein
MKRFALFVPMAVLLFACAPPQEDVASVRKIIEEMGKKSAQELVSGVYDTTLAQYAEDVVSMPNNEPMLKGKGAVREHMRQLMGMGMKFSKVSFTTMDVKVSGSLAYEIGTYAMTFTMPPLGEISDEGKYLTIYERAADGSWKVKVETWNTNRQPEMPSTGS